MTDLLYQTDSYLKNLHRHRPRRGRSRPRRAARPHRLLPRRRRPARRLRASCVWQGAELPVTARPQRPRGRLARPGRRRAPAARGRRALKAAWIGSAATP